MYHAARVAARHELVLLSLVESGEDREALEQLGRELGIEVHAIPHRHPTWTAAIGCALAGWPYHAMQARSSRLAACVARIVASRPFDVVWCHFLKTARHLPPMPAGTLTVLDQHNLEDSRWRQLAGSAGGFWLRAFARRNVRAWEILQARDLPRFDVVLSVAPDEQDYTTRLLGDAERVWLVPNGVATDPVPLPERRETQVPVLLFVGTLHVLMNQDAAIRLAREILPLVRAQVPQAEAWLVGGTPRRRVRALARLPGVRVIGPVADVRPFYARACVAVAPVTLGTGTKLKILEAMNYGVPLVTTPVGIRGIAVHAGRHVLVGATPHEIAEHVVTLARDHDRAARMVAAARELVQGRYRWDDIYAQALERLEERVASGKLERVSYPSR
jgi:glycosyltransferase involved in cell wall biosynthesis